MGRADPPRGESGEWFMHPRLQTFRHLAHEAAARLRRAVAACGYADEAGAADYVGEEFMAIARRLTDGWEAICARPDEASLNAVAHRLAHHLWAVKTDGHAPLAPQDRARAAAAEQATQGHITGRELLLTLAGAVGNDADLVPIFEARHIRADAETARTIARELHHQWTIERTMPKPVFRRILARRLQQAGGRSGT